METYFNVHFTNFTLMKKKNNNDASADDVGGMVHRFKLVDKIIQKLADIVNNSGKYVCFYTLMPGGGSKKLIIKVSRYITEKFPK